MIPNNQYFFRNSNDISWNYSKEISNPIISGTSYKNDQSYPPVVFYNELDSTYYAYVGSTQTRIVAFSSIDGINWTEEVLVLNSADLNVGISYIFPTLLIKNGSDYTLFYVNNASLLTVNYVMRTATSASPLGPFTPQGIFYQASDLNAFSSELSVNGTIITDVVKVGSTYYWFGTSNDFGRFECWYGTSNSITIKPTFQNILFRGVEPNFMRNLVQFPRVFKTTWGWAMIFTDGVQAAMLRERNIMSAYCTTSNPTSFNLVNGVVLDVGNPSEWDERRVYVSIMLKKFDDDSFQDLVKINNKYVMYYSGHDLNTNEGLVGLAYYNRIPDLRQFDSVPQVQFNANPSVAAISNGLIWVEADDNCYYDSNNLVYQIDNKFNVNFTLTSTDGLQPSFVSNAVNGLPALSFSSGNRMFYGNMGSSSGAGVSPASFTIFVVISIASLASDAFVCGSLNAAGANGSIIDIIRIKSDGSIRCYIGNGTANATVTDTSSSGLVLVNTPVLITAKYQAGQDHIDIYVNGVLQALTEVSNSVLTAQNNRENYTLGCAGEYNGLFYTGYIPAFLMFEAALNDTDRGIVETYLIDKYI